MSAAERNGPSSPAAEDLRARVAELESQLREAQETLEAIRTGEVDAVVVSQPEGRQRVYTLESADRPYRALIEEMHEAAVTLGADGMLLYCNRRFMEMVRLPHERIIGTDMRRFVLEADRPAFARLMKGSAVRGMRGELRLLAADGTTVPIYLSLIKLAMEDEHIICGVAADLTEQKEHARELVALDERLVSESAERERAEAQLRQAQKMEVVGQLTGGIAHDFNNLLTVISGSLQLAQDKAIDGDVARLTGAALLAAERGTQLTRQLLAFSRQQNLVPQVIRMPDLLPAMRALLRRTIGMPIAIEMTYPPDLWHCRADRSQIEVALLNLAINARDAMPRGGCLTINAENVELDDAAAAATAGAAPGSYVCLSVADTGDGMAPEVLAHAFEPFFTTKEVGKGSGLGLSQVYGFARQSGGAVVIASEPGEGTKVSLYLPAVEALAAEPSEGAAAEAADPAIGVTVLVVDDDAAVRSLTAELIENMGHRVLAAADGPEALAVMDREPDLGLVLTDIVMPHGMSGIDLAHEFRRRRPDLPILLTTGFTATAMAARLAAENFDVIWKPYTQKELASAIGIALGRGAARARQSDGARSAGGQPRILVVEDDAIVGLLLNQMLVAQDCEVVGPMARLADALKVAEREKFDAALLDVRLGGELVYPLADMLMARGVRFAFMTGYGESVHPAQYEGCLHLSKPYGPETVERLIEQLLA